MLGFECGLCFLCEFSYKDCVLLVLELVCCLKVLCFMVFCLLIIFEVMGFIECVDGGCDFCFGMVVLCLGFEYFVLLELIELGCLLFDCLCDEIYYLCNFVVCDGWLIVYVVKLVVFMLFISLVNVGMCLLVYVMVLGCVLLVDLLLVELC